MGWDRARVNLLTRSISDDNEIAVSVLIRPGPRLLVEATGRKLPNKQILRDTLGIRAGDKVSKNLRQDAERRLADWYAGKGFLNADVEVKAEVVNDETSRVHVHVKPGPRHFVRRFVWPEEEMLSKRDFMGVLIDETPDTLGDRVLTTSGLRRAEELEEPHAANEHSMRESTDFGARASGMGPLPFRFGVPVIVMGPSMRDTGSARSTGGARRARTGSEVGRGLEERHERKPLNGRGNQARGVIMDVYEANGYLEVALPSRPYATGNDSSCRHRHHGRGAGSPRASSFAVTAEPSGR